MDSSSPQINISVCNQTIYLMCAKFGSSGIVNVCVLFFVVFSSSAFIIMMIIILFISFFSLFSSFRQYFRLCGFFVVLVFLFHLYLHVVCVFSFAPIQCVSFLYYVDLLLYCLLSGVPSIFAYCGLR